MVGLILLPSFYLPGEMAMVLSIVEQILQGCNKRL